MSEPLRILVRLVGLVVFVASLVGAGLVVGLGPVDFADKMGKSCSRSKMGPEQWCNWRDALGILEALTYTCLVGGVLVLTMRRDFVGRGRDTQQVVSGTGSGRLGAIGGVVIVVLILVNFAGSFVYRTTFTAVRHVEVGKKILETPRKDPVREAAAKRKPAPAPPRGLARRSLLRAAAFRTAMADVRRAAPAGARLTRLRVAADRIDAEVLAGRRVVTLRRPWNGKVTVVSKAPATDGDTPIVTFARLDPAAPQRIAAAAGPSAVDYLVLMDAAGLRWRGFLRGGGGQVTASPDGRHV